MIIAQGKKKNNIAEYIIYMWQLEDLIRSLDLDIDKIQSTIIDRFDVPAHKKKEIKDWYTSLIDMILEERKAESGHLQIITNILNDLYDLHLRMMKSTQELSYIDAYNQAKPGIDDLMRKAKGGAAHELEACFNGLYGLLILKLQKKQITTSTIDAVGKISKMIAILTQRYHQVEKGEIEI